MGHYQRGRSLCHSRAWLPREESRIPGVLAHQANETRENDKKEGRKLTHYRANARFAKYRRNIK